MSKILVSVIFGLFVLMNVTYVFATGVGENAGCVVSPDNCDTSLGLYCNAGPTNPAFGICKKGVFGKITPPEALKGFIGNDVSGAAGISAFLSNLITLIYSMAAIALIFMILWGAFEWLTSGGDKEAVAKARGRIINAMIGILIFAAAFAMLQVLGTFTGFKFFEPIPKL